MTDKLATVSRQMAKRFFQELFFTINKFGVLTMAKID